MLYLFFLSSFFYYNNVIHHYTIAILSINYFADKTSSCEWIALLLLSWFYMNVIVIILGVSIVAIEIIVRFLYLRKFVVRHALINHHAIEWYQIIMLNGGIAQFLQGVHIELTIGITMQKTYQMTVRLKQIIYISTAMACIEVVCL